MESDKEESAIIKAVMNAQDSANKQAMLNTVNLQKVFGPRLDNLTSSINTASSSSSFLSKVIICVAVIGTLIAAVDWYSNYQPSNDYRLMSDEKLACIMEHGKNQNSEIVKVALELCSRKNK